MASLSIFARLLTGFWLILVHLTLTSAFTCPPKDAFDWESVSFTSAYVKDTLTPCAPCKDIQWTPCYNAMFCARLKVPLDYENPQGDELAIALLKVPAHISTSDPAYRGSVLINPGGFGGPGGSGVDMALQLGPTIQTVIGPEFDIIGFDPRGVGRTTPGINAFRGANLQKQLLQIRHLDVPTVDDSDEALPRTIAINKLINRLIADKAARIAPYVGTSAVARDMLSIIEALGQEKLQYWGMGYGSVLGMTFASLFPDKVGRVIVDGIVDANAWYKGDFTESFRDTDSIISVIASQCAATTECPLHEATAEAVQKRLFNIFESLRTKMVTLYDGVETMVYIDRKIALFSLTVALGTPYTSSEPLFEALADLGKGDALKFHNLVGIFTGNYTVPCQDCNPLTVANGGAPPDVDVSIQCADTGPISDDLAPLRSLYDTLAAKSSSTVESALALSVRCTGWLLESKTRFEGTVGGDTSFPLLFIGNTHDNITPLQSALAMSPLFNGSTVLTRDAIGHTSLSGTSPCTSKVVRDYFRDGVLPTPGAICDDIVDPVFGSKTAPTK